jgi:integrase
MKEGININANIIPLGSKSKNSSYENYIKEFKFAPYAHVLIINMERITRYLIVLKKGDMIVYFTNYDIYLLNLRKIMPVQFSNRDEIYTICAMLNYVMIENYNDFKCKCISELTYEQIQEYIRRYAMHVGNDGKNRSKQSISKCRDTLTKFFYNISKKKNDEMKGFYGKELYEKISYYHTGHEMEKKASTFFAMNNRNNSREGKIYLRDMNDDIFRILIMLSKQYTPDITFQIASQGFGGLRIGETCNMRREDSIYGPGIRTHFVGDVPTLIEIDISKEFVMRSDKKNVGKIKRERNDQKIYIPRTQEYYKLYKEHLKITADKNIENYRPMFINNKKDRNTGIYYAMTDANYRARFNFLANKLMEYLIKSDNSSYRAYGLLMTQRLFTPHVLRHYFSVQLVLNGESAESIQNYRGDTSPESANTYLRKKGELMKLYRSSTNNFINNIINYTSDDFNED